MTTCRGEEAYADNVKGRISRCGLSGYWHKTLSASGWRQRQTWQKVPIPKGHRAQPAWE